MRMTRLFLPTERQPPADAEALSHKLMVRAGLVRQLGAGAYTYLPLGFRVLNKVVRIIREEMDAAGAQELLMPALQPIAIAPGETLRARLKSTTSFEKGTNVTWALSATDAKGTERVRQALDLEKGFLP